MPRAGDVDLRLESGPQHGCGDVGPGGGVGGVGCVQDLWGEGELAVVDSGGFDWLIYPVLMISGTVPREVDFSCACFPIDLGLAQWLALPWKLV